MKKSKQIREIEDIISSSYSTEVLAQMVFDNYKNYSKRLLIRFCDQLKTIARWHDNETCDDDYNNLCIMVSGIDNTLKEFLKR